MVKRDPTPYPLIDSDPHFHRVVRYMRPADYAIWAGVAAWGPGFMAWKRHYDPVFRASTTRSFGTWGPITIGLFIQGFFIAYQQSAFRFMGEKENNRELLRDWEEMRQTIKDQKKPLYGYSRLSDYGQSVAMRVSTNSPWTLNLLPIFNFVNHKFHDTDQDYYRGLENLKPPGYRTTFIGVE